MLILLEAKLALAKNPNNAALQAANAAAVAKVAKTEVNLGALNTKSTNVASVGKDCR